MPINLSNVNISLRQFQKIAVAATISAKSSIEYVNDFLVRDCPPLCKRDYLHRMFKAPNA